MNAELFQALADPTRRRIVSLLGDGAHCVCEFQRLLRVPQPTVSRHLAVLRQAGLVTDHRDGRWVFYSLERSLGPAVLRFMQRIEPAKNTSRSPSRQLRRQTS
jgi:ArsR family transcriptional regulator